MKEDKSLLNYCNCCSGIKKLTPASIENPPGLSSIKYRVGTYGQFKQSMHTKLGQVLDSLETRENDDMTIGIVDACATMLDILTFYQERIANEGFLNTAKERRSVLELARTIGYELNPGVSASTFLSFILEDAQKDVEKVTIPEGTAVQTLPGQDELPQVFQTDETIETRPEWNELKPRLTTQPDLNSEKDEGIIYLKGINLNLDPGDALLLIIKTKNADDEEIIKTDPVKIFSVKEDTETQQTKLEVTEYPKPQNYEILEYAPVEVTTQNEPQLEPFEIIRKVMSKTLNQSEFMSKMLTSKLKTEDIVKSINYFVKNPSKETSIPSQKSQINESESQSRSKPNELTEDDIGVYAFRVRANVFGHNAPDWKGSSDWGNILVNLKYLKDPQCKDCDPKHIDVANVTYTSLGQENQRTIHLDNIYTKILDNSWIILNGNVGATPFRVDTVTDKSVAGFSLSSKSTALSVTSGNLSKYMIRDTTVYAQSEKLELAERPYQTDPFEKSIELDKMVDGLKKGQLLAITGEPTDFPGIINSSIATIDNVSHSNGYTKLDFVELLPNYLSSSITINANVAPTSHGEKKDEVLGSGDLTKKNMELILKQNPLTHIHTSNETGITSTLEIRVNDILWKNVPSLNYLDENDEAYTVRIDDDGKSHIVFGDGVNGKIPPTGSENITAKYRVGLGLNGIVKENKISLLKNRPYGVKSVSNPTSSTGAEDSEKLEDARKNATKRILTMDRIVSLKDVEHYALAFPGIGKAKSIWFWNAEKQTAHLTVATADGEPIDMTSKLYSSLKESINTYKDPLLTVQIDTFAPKFFGIVTRITIDKRIEFEKVSESVRELLVERFSFTKRNFGQPVTISEIMSTIQDVSGVNAVDIDEISYLKGDETIIIELDNKGGIIPASDANFKNSHFNQAELLMVNPNEIVIHKMSSKGVTK